MRKRGHSTFCFLDGEMLNMPYIMLAQCAAGAVVAICRIVRDVSCWNAMNKLFGRVKEEIIAVLPPTIFFFLTLHLVAIVRMLMLKGSGIAVGTPLQVTVAALILGKAVLVADMLPFINLYPHNPLIYN